MDIDVELGRLIFEVAEKMCGEDNPRSYLNKQKRTLCDILAGRPVRPWRYERLERFLSAIAEETSARAISSGGCIATDLDDSPWLYAKPPH